MVVSTPTAPCLLSNLLSSDLRVTQGSEICRHTYITSHDRSSLPALDERPNPASRWSVTSACSRCRCHLEISINFAASTQPCPNRDFPLHHFLYEHYASVPGGESLTFECSAPPCRATLRAALRGSALSPEDIAFLVDPVAIQTRYKLARAQHPAAAETGALDILRDFRSYIDDSIWNDRDKRIPAFNKRFMLALGDGAKSILKGLGFREQVANTEPLETSWLLPQPVIGGEAVNEELQDKLQDVKDELDILIQHVSQQDSEQNDRHSSVRDMQRILGSLDYEKDYTTNSFLRAQQEDESIRPYYIHLGALPDFSDGLIEFCYSRQTLCDPEKIPMYFQCLREIASARQSDTLQLRATMLESRGVVSQNMINEAYQYFNIQLDHANVVTDNMIIDRYNARLPDVGPDERVRAKHMLKLLADARNSQAMRDASSDTIETYEQALAYLDTDASQSDEFIPSLVAVKVEQNPHNRELARKAVEIIAKYRESKALYHYLERGDMPDDHMSVQEAYNILGITDPPSTTDEMINDSFTIASSDNPSRREELRQALEIVAKDRDSAVLQVAASDQQHSFFQPSRDVPQSEPRGLRNIGNTCYLNSLLQYLFSFKAIRDIVEDFDEIKEILEPGVPLQKKVSDLTVRKQQVERAQNFVIELRKLFDTLATSREPFIQPDVELARLTLMPDEHVEVARRRSTVTGPRPTPLSPAASGKAPLLNEPILEAQNAEDEPQITMTPIELSQQDIEMTNQQPESQPTNLAPNHVPVENSLIDLTPDTTTPSLTDTSTNENIQEPATNEQTKEPATNEQVHDSSEYQKLESHDDEMTASTLPSETQTQTNSVEKFPETPNNPPPVPPRPEVFEAKKEQVEMWAQQQDVRVVIENILQQLRWATKPEGKEESGEQIDSVSRLFYGKEAYVTVTGTKQEVLLEPFFELFVFLPKPSCDIYAALDEALDRSEVEGSVDRSQYRTLKEAPPILQISVQRVDFSLEKGGHYKVENQLRLSEEFYLDRYMDNPETLQKREEAWTLKSKIKQLNARKAELTPKHIDMDMPTAWRSLGSYLKDLTVNAEHLGLDADLVDDNSLQIIERMATEAQEELQEIQNEIANFETRLDRLFSPIGELKYRLHSVFVHRGDSTRGHWLIYIYDSKEQVWRMYNDETITKVSDTSAIFEPDASKHGTSSLVTYILDSKREEIVETVHRRAKPPEPAHPYPGASTFSSSTNASIAEDEERLPPLEDGFNSEQHITTHVVGDWDK